MDRTRCTRLLLVAIAATVTLLSACDGSSDGNAGASPTTTNTDTAAADESEFFDQYSGLCATHNKAIGGVIGPLFANAEPTPEAMQEALDSVVDLSRKLADDIDALVEPLDLSDEVTAIVDALNDGTDRAAAQTGPEFFGSEEDPWAQATAMAEAYGFPDCSAEGG